MAFDMCVSTAKYIKLQRICIGNEGNHNVSIFGVLEVSNKWGPTNQWNSHVLFFSLQINTHPNL